MAVLCHPVRNSFSGAVFDAVCAGAVEAGMEVDMLDLHRDPFNTDVTAEDLAQFGGVPMPEDVRRMQDRVQSADALAIVYPVYWWTFPSRLRGWFDRVFSVGWAYRMTDGPDKGLLRDRPTAMFPQFGAGRDTVEQFGYGPAMRRLIDVGHFDYCGLRDLRVHPVFDVHESEAARAAGLADARRAGIALAQARTGPSPSAW